MTRDVALAYRDTRVPARLAYLTREGCRLTGGDLPDRGTPVTIDIGGVGRVNAEIIWRNGEAVGCAFMKSLPPGAVTAAMRQNVRASGSDADHRANWLDKVVPVKWSPRARIAIIGLLAIACWSVLMIIAVAVS
jgi:hypothetical protein